MKPLTVKVLRDICDELIENGHPDALVTTTSEHYPMGKHTLLVTSVGYLISEHEIHPALSFYSSSDVDHQIIHEETDYCRDVLFNAFGNEQMNVTYGEPIPRVLQETRREIDNPISRTVQDFIDDGKKQAEMVKKQHGGRRLKHDIDI